MVERPLSMREALGSMPRFSNSFWSDGATPYIPKTTATGFEPARAEPIGFQVQLLNLSDTLSIRNMLSWHTLSMPLLSADTSFFFFTHPDKNSTPVGFEPTRAEPTGLAGRRLNHSAKASYC